MSTDDAVRQHVLNALRSAADRRFEEAVRDFPAAFVNVKPPHVDYTPWHLLEHIRIGQWDILEYIRNRGHVSPPWPDGYWPDQASTVDMAAWTASLDSYRADRKALEELVANPSTDLVAPIPGTPGHTIMREALLVVGHSAFHVGEFAILRQVMQTWPETRGK